MASLPHSFNDISGKYYSVILNLSTISNINKNDKLFISDSKLVIQPYSSTRSFVRWWNKYNRNDCMDFIRELYKNISSLNIQLVTLTRNLNSNVKKRKRNKVRRANYSRKLELINKCKDTKEGLRNLMMTYKNDSKFVDFINNILKIIDKMD